MYKPLSQEEIQRIKNEKKQKQNEKKQKVTENRKHLASVRVVQRNLVFVVGLSQRLADPEVSTVSALTSWETSVTCDTGMWWYFGLMPMRQSLDSQILTIKMIISRSVNETSFFRSLPTGPKTTRVFWEIWENP